MVKTRHQLNHLQNESVWMSLKKLYQEGGITRFYRGMTAEVVGIVPKSAGMYASYEIVKRKLDSINGFRGTTTSALIAGFASGIPESLIVTPTQVVKVRLQAKEHLGRYRGPMDCIRQLVRDEGLSAFYIGLSPTLFRNCVWNTVYFGTVHWLKQTMPVASSRSGEVAQTLVSGFFGAVFATCFNVPFDVSSSHYFLVMF
jgi:solute carrier family 25 (mitochondrial 2-oxodicarboxylate transporter), member 21